MMPKSDTLAVICGLWVCILSSVSLSITVEERLGSSGSTVIGVLGLDEQGDHVRIVDSQSLRKQLPSLPQLPSENEYDTDLSITHLDISFKTDFQSNNVSTAVKASVENFSGNIVENAEFSVCPGNNDPYLSAGVKRIYLLEKEGKKDLCYTVRRIKDPYFKGYEREILDIYVVSFPRPVKPGEKLDIEFEYTMKGKPNHSSAPIYQSEDGLKELFLRDDFEWCPRFYVEYKPGVFSRVYRPSWKMSIEYPAGYVAAVSGELVKREERGDVVKEEWTSSLRTLPSVFISKYSVERRTKEGFTLEVYAPNEELLKKGAERFDDYIRIFHLYVELYGYPGSSTYRIVGSPVQSRGGAFGIGMGHVSSMYNLEFAPLVAHEMAHTWWGGTVSSYGEGSKFLREAMAEFSSMWAMSLLEEASFASQLRTQKIRTFCPQFVIPSAEVFPLINQEGYNPQEVTKTNYRKGPLVLNQIRLILGDEFFFKCLKAFAVKHKEDRVNIYDFIDTINRVSGRDLTPELKCLLWSAGYPSYRLIGFDSTKEDGGYRTKVRIQNDGAYGLTCPLLLKMRGREKREAFKVETNEEKEFVFRTEERVIEVVIDPDLTAFQYHPRQKVKLWMAIDLHSPPFERGSFIWVWYGKSYMYYILGEHKKAIETITEYFSYAMKQGKVASIGELLKKKNWRSFIATYLFMRSVYYLALDDREYAEEDIRTVFPWMLDVMLQRESVRPPGDFYTAGAISENNLDQYLSLLTQITGREFSFEKGFDEEAKKRKVKEWKQWWEQKGKYQKLDLDLLKERFEAHRQQESWRHCFR
ncbi:MAG: M1 family metallopeptidase [Planctomycetes bacterium]|nr:M1 family metallopeptidase [Planctomycetota bacterium]